ncbi:hypothetical protein HAX54_017777 [Datura stramonium]|uniref:Uncharacterized protein n=1 Tax=Datura stramonium TaxID=4076 RepID=A0ABS8UL85_DATST|nr:hypothetical protein [Datura stramonium]
MQDREESRKLNLTAENATPLEIHFPVADNDPDFNFPSYEFIITSLNLGTYGPQHHISEVPAKSAESLPKSTETFRIDLVCHLWDANESTSCRLRHSEDEEKDGAHLPT